MTIDKESLNKIRKSLPHGSINKIAGKTGMTRQAVSNVLKGKYFNESIINEALTLIKETKTYGERIERAINELIAN